MFKKRRILTFNNLTISLLLLFMVGLTGWFLGFEGKTPQLNPVNASVSGEEDQAKAVQEKLGAALSQLRIPFVKNEGQVDKAVKYYAQTFGGTVFVTEKGELVYSLPKFEKADKQGSSGKIEGVVLKEQLTGGAVKSVTAQEKSETQVSYFRGSDPKNWKSGISTFSKVNLGEVYKGVDVSLKAYGNNVEKLFYVKPGANPDAINIGITGAKDLKVNEKGQLVLATKLGDVTFSKPIAYQEIDGKRVNVEASYEIKGTEEGNLQYAFNVAEYDRTKELVIDPILQSSFLGGTDAALGTGFDIANDVAIHPTNGVYVVGTTGAADFPGVVVGTSADFTFGGNTEAVVSRLSSDLTTLVQSTYLGGTDTAVIIPPAFPGIPGTASETGNGIAIHPTSGDVYIVGSTDSPAPSFPALTGADITADAAGVTEAFVAWFSSNLQTLNRTTFVGGPSAGVVESGNEIAIHPTAPNDVYIVGTTNVLVATTFPGIAAGISADSAIAANEPFVTQLSSDLTLIRRSTFVGGTDVVPLTEAGNGIAIHPTAPNDVYIVGTTSATAVGVPATDFPGILVSVPPAPGSAESVIGGVDAFVSRLSSDLTAIKRSTYVGGVDAVVGIGEVGNDIAIHPTIGPSGDIYIIGTTATSTLDFSSGGAQPTNAEFPAVAVPLFTDAFVAQLSTDLQSEPQSTFIGGTLADTGTGIAINTTSGDVYASGVTASLNFPATGGGADTTNTGTSEAFVTQLRSDLRAVKRDPKTLKTLRAFKQSTFLGGSATEGTLSTFLVGVDVTPVSGTSVVIHPTSGDIYAVGTTASADFPVTTGGGDPALQGTAEGFVSRLNSLSSGPVTPPVGVVLGVTITESTPPAAAAKQVEPGDQLTYTVAVTNSGTSAATGVVLTVDLADVVSYVSDGSGCTVAGQIVTCNLGTIAGGTSTATANASVTVNIVAEAATVGTGTTTASVDSNETDPTTPVSGGPTTVDIPTVDGTPTGKIIDKTNKDKFKIDIACPGLNAATANLSTETVDVMVGTFNTTIAGSSFVPKGTKLVAKDGKSKYTIFSDNTMRLKGRSITVNGTVNPILVQVTIGDDYRCESTDTWTEKIKPSKTTFTLP